MHYFRATSQEKSVRVSNSIKMAVLVRALRNAFGMSQGYLAQVAGLSRPTLNRIETMDKRSPRADTLEDLLHVFRSMGVEITLYDEEINIRFTQPALLAAGSSLEGNVISETDGKSDRT